MMTTPELSNSFSWHRFGMVARFYYPRLKKQIILYPLLSLLTLLLTIAIAKIEIIPMGILTPLGLLSSVLLWFGPAIFMMQEGPEVETALPAKGCEKALFIMAYSLIGIPLLINLFSLIFTDYTQELMQGFVFGTKLSAGTQGAVDISQLNDFINAIRGNWIIIISSTLISIFPCLITLYMTVRGQRHRIIWSLVWMIVYGVSFCILAFAAGFISALSNNAKEFAQSISAITDTHDQTQAVLEFSLPIINSLMTSVGIYTFALSVVLIVLTYRAIVNRQVS